MMRRYWVEACLLVLAMIYPCAPWLDDGLMQLTGFAPRLPQLGLNIFIFAIVVLALNLQVGYAGLLQLGIAAFFAIGIFATGILTVEKYPFQIGFWWALVTVPWLAAAAGVLLGVPTMRLRGDYLAIVTLGFGEVVRVVLLNLENVTDGARGINPLPPPWLPSYVAQTLGPQAPFYTLYYVALACLMTTMAGFAMLQRTWLGRALLALRDDEVAAASLGQSPARIRLAAFAGGAGLAGLAGVLYATYLTTTAEPNTYDFNYSVMALCAVILGGLASPRGAVLGAALLLCFDNLISPLLTRWLQNALGDGGTGHVLLTFANWRWLIFGSVLIIMMRWRPRGLWPAKAPSHG